MALCSGSTGNGSVGTEDPRAQPEPVAVRIHHELNGLEEVLWLVQGALGDRSPLDAHERFLDVEHT